MVIIDSFVTYETNYDVRTTDQAVFAKCTSGPVTFFLPNAASVAHQTLYFKKVDSTTNAMMLQAPSGETIDGSSSISTIVQYTAFTLVSDGVNFYIL